GHCHQLWQPDVYERLAGPNFTLSAARAREARKLLIQALNEEQAKRVIVAGYGDSHPLEGKDPGDARNRRVEIQLSPSGSGKAADDN
ncbi:OmpA/MotB family protein, partial [Pseudomonas aeruginosa]